MPNRRLGLGLGCSRKDLAHEPTERFVAAVSPNVT
jgi:hypothetical protein